METPKVPEAAERHPTRATARSRDKRFEPDARLVALVRYGSDEAFATIVRRYREPLLRFAARIVGGSGGDAEDVVQDAFMRALLALRATDRPIALRPWLYVIVRNAAFDQRQKQGRTDLSDALHLVCGPSRDDPAARAVAQAEFKEVVAGITRLPERQRRVLVKRELGGAPYHELCAELGAGMPAIKSLLYRARSALAAAPAA